MNIRSFNLIVNCFYDEQVGMYMNTNYGALMKMLRVVDSKEGGNVNDI